MASENCDALIQHFEVRYGIPKGLLKAISRVESGRNITGQGVVAWPWTINCNGQAYFLKNKREAIAKAKMLQGRGVVSMDVGPMQINLKHHPNAFFDLEEAFDPAKNICYAAQFLVQKRNDQGNWQDAVAHYHSATTSFNVAYREKVMGVWSTIMKMPPQEAPLYRRRVPGGMTHTVYATSNNRRIPVKVQFARYRYGQNSQVSKRSMTRGAVSENRLRRYVRHNPYSIIQRPGDGHERHSASPSVIHRHKKP
jgi:hypothetical protein